MIKTTTAFHRRRVRCTFLAYLSLSVIVSGCGMAKGFYGSAASPEDVAVIRGYGTTLREVNGFQIGSNAQGVIMLPGRNEIKFTINSSNFNAGDTDDLLLSLVMIAQGGKEYVITSQSGSGRICAWPVDKKTGSPDFSKDAGCATRK